LGQSPINQGKYSKAEPLFIRSSSIAEQALGHNNPIVSKILTVINRVKGMEDNSALK
jgi:hypothetical protein